MDKWCMSIWSIKWWMKCSTTLAWLNWFFWFVGLTVFIRSWWIQSQELLDIYMKSIKWECLCHLHRVCPTKDKQGFSWVREVILQDMFHIDRYQNNSIHNKKRPICILIFNYFEFSTGQLDGVHGGIHQIRVVSLAYSSDTSASIILISVTIENSTWTSMSMCLSIAIIGDWHIIID